LVLFVDPIAAPKPPITSTLAQIGVQPVGAVIWNAGTPAMNADVPK